MPATEGKTAVEEMPATEEKQLTVGDKEQTYFAEIGQWSLVLGIFSAIYLGFMVLMGVVYICVGIISPLESMGSLEGILFGVFFILLAFLMFFPTKYLINGGKKLRTGIRGKNQEGFSEGVANTKSFFKFTAIYCIAVIPFSLIVGLVAALIAVL